MRRARDPHVYVADVDQLVCPFLPICDPVVNGTLVKYNKTHITPAFAKTLAVPVGRYLQELGALAPG